MSALDELLGMVLSDDDYIDVDRARELRHPAYIELTELRDEHRGFQIQVGNLHKMLAAAEADADRLADALLSLEGLGQAAGYFWANSPKVSNALAAHEARRK